MASMNRGKSLEIAHRMRRHLAAAATTAAVMSAAAHAAIVYSGVVNINIPSDGGGVYLNVLTGATGSTIGATPGWDVNVWGSNDLAFWKGFAPGFGYVRGLGDQANRVDNLGSGTLIDTFQSFDSGNAELTGSTAFLLDSSDNLVGFRFVDESTGLAHYGWMRLSLDATLFAQPRTIVEYAYESVAGMGILAGATASAVPGSGLAGMMLAVVAGVGRRRRR